MSNIYHKPTDTDFQNIRNTSYRIYVAINIQLYILIRWVDHFSFNLHSYGPEVHVSPGVGEPASSLARRWLTAAARSCRWGAPFLRAGPARPALPSAASVPWRRTWPRRCHRPSSSSCHDLMISTNSCQEVVNGSKQVESLSLKFVQQNSISQIHGTFSTEIWFYR